MPRAATDVMQSILFSAVLDAVEALKTASRGLPNQMVRDLQSIHPNTTFADLPKELQDAIAASTRTAFAQLLKEGYAVGPRQAMAATRPLDRVPERDRSRSGQRPAGSRPGGPRPSGPGRGQREGQRDGQRDGQGRGPGRGQGSGDGQGKPGGPGQGRRRPPKGKPRLS